MPSFSLPFVSANTLSSGSTFGFAAACADDVAVFFAPQLLPDPAPLPLAEHSHGAQSLPASQHAQQLSSAATQCSPPAHGALTLSATALTPALAQYGPQRAPPAPLDEVLAVAAAGRVLAVVRGARCELYAAPASGDAAAAAGDVPRLFCVLPAATAPRCVALSTPLTLPPPPDTDAATSNASAAVASAATDAADAAAENTSVRGVLLALGSADGVTVWALPLPQALLPCTGVQSS